MCKIITITINPGGCVEPKIINAKIASWIEFLNNDTEMFKLSNKYGDITTGNLEIVAGKILALQVNIL